MTKEEIIKKVTENGFITNLSLENDCLYCSVTQMEYLLNEFIIIDTFPFSENNQLKNLCTVNSDRFNIKGYYIK